MRGHTCGLSSVATCTVIGEPFLVNAESQATLRALLRRGGKWVLCTASISLVALMVLPSTWLLLGAQSVAGVGIAIVGLSVGLLPTTCYLWLAPRTRRRFWGWTSLVLGCVTVTALDLVLLGTPIGRPPPGSPVQHRFTRPATFQRYTFANIVPESEQVRLGFLTMPYLDPLLTRDQARRVSAFTLELYREMEHSRDFHQLGSAMGWAYAEVMGRPFDVGHYYLYVPRNRDSAPLPAVVFLHGSAGNFKAYTWVWSRFAERHGVVVIAPSFGFGNWRHPEGTTAVLRALEDAETVTAIDRDRVYLAGLSNGGLGALQLAWASPQTFRGAILLSPVMDTEIVGQASFQAVWRGRPMLVITGGEDKRIPVTYIEQRVSRLSRGGVDVTYVLYPDEDHFLFFSQPVAVLDNISDWMSMTGE